MGTWDAICFSRSTNCEPFICGMAKVGQHQVHRSLGKDADGLLPVGGGNHPVSVGGQHELEHGKLLLVVVYAENDLLGSHGLGLNSFVQGFRRQTTLRLCPLWRQAGANASPGSATGSETAISWQILRPD